MYVLKRKLNNNAILVENEMHLEFVLMGAGISFNIKSGDVVQEEKIGKKFVLEAGKNAEKLISFVKDIPANRLILVDKIVQQAERDLNASFDPEVYVGIADHINYAITRAKKGLLLKNVMTSEIKKLHPKVFNQAMKALDEIKYEEGLEFPEDEAAYIALHFINAMTQGEDIHFVGTYTEIFSAIMKIIENYFQIEVDTDSINYSRFETHMKYLVRRLINNDQIKEDAGSEFLFTQVTSSFPRAYECALKVDAYVENNYQMRMNRDEIIYFVIHIQRIVTE